MTVVVERAGEVLLIAMSRGHKRNAVDRDLALGLDAALNRLERERGLRAGVLTGTATVFSAGTDMYDPREKATTRGGEYGVIRRARTKPLIAAVEGPAVGGGFEIVLACDLVVAAEDATFGLPEARRGLVATSGALFRAPRALPRHIATELLLTGATLSARRGYDLGLVNRVVPSGTALEEAVALAGEVALSGPVAVAETLRALQELTREDDARGWEVTDRAKAAILASDDAAEGRAAFAEKRAPRWEGR